MLWIVFISSSFSSRCKIWFLVQFLAVCVCVRLLVLVLSSFVEIVFLCSCALFFFPDIHFNRILYTYTSIQQLQSIEITFQIKSYNLLLKTIYIFTLFAIFGHLRFAIICSFFFYFVFFFFFCSDRDVNGDEDAPLGPHLSFPRLLPYPPSPPALQASPSIFRLVHIIVYVFEVRASFDVITLQRWMLSKAIEFNCVLWGNNKKLLENSIHRWIRVNVYWICFLRLL